MKNQNVNKNEIIKVITPIIEKAASELGLTALEVDFVQEGGRWHLRTFIYHPEHPICHKDCEDITKALDEILEPLIPVNFYFEVSSPGTEKKLKNPKEYIVFTGKKVNVKLRQPLENGTKTFDALIEGYDEEKGLSLKLIDNNEIITIDPKNISSIKLIADYIV
ncbi:MAG: hypothetical protein WCK67_02940 [bacterium]